MFKLSLLSCLLLAGVVQSGLAQDKKGDQLPPFPRSSVPSIPTVTPALPNVTPELLQALPAGESESPYHQEKKDEWTPAMRVFLNEAPGVQATVQKKTVTRQLPVTNYKPVQKNGKVIHVPETTVQSVSQTIRLVTAGATVIDCDDVNVQVSTSEKGSKTFGFEIKGKLKLQNGSSLIEAKSAKLVDGKLTLTDVTLHTESMKMTCAELVLDMKVSTLRVGEATEPVAPKSSPIPTPFDSNPFPPSFIPTPAASFGNPFSSKSDSKFKVKKPEGVFKSN